MSKNDEVLKVLKPFADALNLAVEILSAPATTGTNVNAEKPAEKKSLTPPAKTEKKAEKKTASAPAEKPAAKSASKKTEAAAPAKSKSAAPSVDEASVKAELKSMDVKEIITLLKNSGISVRSNVTDRKLLTERVIEGINLGKIKWESAEEADEDDEEVEDEEEDLDDESEDDEEDEDSDDDEDEEEEEEDDEDDEEEEDDESEDEDELSYFPEDMTAKRKKAIAKLTDSIKADVKAKKIKKSEMEDFVSSFYTDDEEPDGELLAQYIEARTRLIDDDGKEVEMGNPFVLNGYNACCGHYVVSSDSDENIGICVCCGSEYNLGDDDEE